MPRSMCAVAVIMHLCNWPSCFKAIRPTMNEFNNHILQFTLDMWQQYTAVQLQTPRNPHSSPELFKHHLYLKHKLKQEKQNTLFFIVTRQNVFCVATKYDSLAH
ncbi:hypothetical protein XENORESO_020657 [Xenotaenia resolanae]|uniref:Secreted protein n=1 Tax=Xenotaenia resolanae TaxID=208358 RepID=A0ABV0VN68_9TELE